MNFLGPLFRFLAEACGIISKRSDLRNAPDVKTAAKAQEAVNENNRMENALKNKDVDEIRKICAE